MSSCADGHLDDPRLARLGGPRVGEGAAWEVEVGHSV